MKKLEIPFQEYVEVKYRVFVNLKDEFFKVSGKNECSKYELETFKDAWCRSFVSLIRHLQIPAMYVEGTEEGTNTEINGKILEQEIIDTVCKAVYYNPDNFIGCGGTWCELFPMEYVDGMLFPPLMYYEYDEDCDYSYINGIDKAIDDLGNLCDNIRKMYWYDDMKSLLFEFATDMHNKFLLNENDGIKLNEGYCNESDNIYFKKLDKMRSDGILPDKYKDLHFFKLKYNKDEWKCFYKSFGLTE